MREHLNWIHSVHHDGSPLYVLGERPAIGECVTLRLRAGLDSPIERIFLRTAPDGEQAMAEMQQAGQGDACRWWEISVKLSMPRMGYRFLLLTDEGSWWFTAAGMVRHTPTDATDFKLLAGFEQPGWLEESVFYQIFPDRFADGDPTNNVRDGEYLYYGRPVVARRWGEPPCPESGPIEFFGGDLQGIIERLPYLESLGVNALYLNPIFVAPSNHKYDCEDYESVDPHLGGNEALVALRQALDERGMRLVLDIVPNHCGATHPWFTAAQSDAKAPTAEFFTFQDHPTEYASWLGARSLPKLNYRSQRLREVMYEGPEAILRRWLRPPYRIDGWRVDVANMLARQGESQLGHKIGRALRRAVKEENPEAYLLGEHFFDGTPHLQGEEMDGSMNYRGFGFPLLHWVAGFDLPLLAGAAWADRHPLPTKALAAQWQSFLAAIPWQVARQQLNLLGSHDTPRLLTVLGGDEARARLATTLLFTFPGVPSIFYGDEVGLTGGADPGCRGCMPWERSRWNEGLHEHYRALIRLRRRSPALHRGGFQLLHATANTLAFLREAPEERLLVIARREADDLRALPVRHGGIPDGLRFRDFFSGAEAIVERGHLSLEGLSQSGALLLFAPGRGGLQ